MLFEGDDMDIQKTIITSRSAGDIVIFDIGGEFTRWGQALPTLSELVKAKLNEGENRILLNFEKTGFVDSYGVGELTASFISTRNSGGMLKLCRIPDKLDLIFKITGLDKVLSIYPTEEAALEAFSR
jgi:anti-anti-sigma factor